MFFTGLYGSQKRKVLFVHLTLIAPLLQRWQSQVLQEEAMEGMLLLHSWMMWWLLALCSTSTF